MPQSFNPECVKLQNGIFNERAAINRKYLLELDSTCLLQNFYIEAGIIIPGYHIITDPGSAKLHWGWEAPNCQLRGHFLGHWLSATSFLIANTGDGELKVKLDFIISELEKCQKFNGGKWIGSIPEKYFDFLETDRYIWSPQYTMHKTLLGLLHSYLYAKNQKALKILDNAADWYVKWIKKVSKECPAAIHKGEEGGMLEVWASLYGITKKEKYKALADAYGSPALFEKLLGGNDPLTNIHCNATIPHAHGAAKMYEVTGDERWLKIVKAFWKCAVEDRSYYATGSMNAGEYWIPPFMQAHFMGDRNQEFCTVYNMVRLADYLYKFTGDKKYTDFIELNLYNGFLAQQNKESGMPTYFLPMQAGSYKTWGSKTKDFWCCHGSMVQSQTLYPTLCYYYGDKNEIYINQYIPSVLDDREKGIFLVQSSGMKYYYDAALFDETSDSLMSRWLLNFKITTKDETTLCYRIPCWINGEPVIKINGHEEKITTKDGYASLTKKWNDDEISVFFPSKVSFIYTDDDKNLAALRDGPVVLAGLISGDKGLCLKKAGDEPDTILTPHLEHIYTSYPWLQNTYRTKDQPENFEFKPLYEIKDEQYTLYFTIKCK